MDIVLIVFGVLGIGAIIISVYVFTVAARTYIAADERNHRARPSTRTAHQMVPRSATDRRSGEPVQFPLTVNGMLIMDDRRIREDRRAAA